MAIINGDGFNNKLIGTLFADVISGFGGNDLLSGLMGNDILNGGGGDDRLDGGLGDDLLIGGFGNDTLDGGAGTDTASYSDARASVTVNLALAGAQNTGGAGLDTLLNVENLTGSNFNDTLTGNGGNNVLLGGAGNDTLSGGDNGDQLEGGAGDDLLFGDASKDVLSGGDGNDQLFGGASLDGLRGGLGNDLLNGGLERDVAYYNNSIINGLGSIGATAGVTVNLGLTGPQNTVGAGIDTLLGIESLVGSKFNDTFTGNSGGNFLSGDAGNDSLFGLAGDDSLFGDTGDDQLNGGAGDDQLTGGSGNDTLDGGIGIDTVVYSEFDSSNGTTAGVTVNLNLAGAQNTVGTGLDTFVSIENLLGSKFNDTVTGNGGNNFLTGEAGNDSLFGLAGDDRIFGGIGDDQLNGGSGNDTLNGGYGTDTLSGGLGIDSFDYNEVDQSPVGTGRDKILDFAGASGGFGDMIDLTRIDANSLLAGNQDFSYIGSGAFTAAGQLRYDAGTGILQGSIDADVSAEFEIQLVGTPSLTVGGIGTDILL